MPYVSLMDLISSCPAELEAGSIIVFDWCNRVLQQIPTWITCEDVLACIDCSWFLDNIISFSWGIIVDQNACRVWLDMGYINQNITASINCLTWLLTIGTTTIDLSCIADMFSYTFTDGLNTYTINNWDAIFVQGLHGLQMIIGTNIIQVDLPSWWTSGQVLTWDATHSVGYWANSIDICCDQIQACMNPIINSLQHQINIIAQQLCPCWNGGEWAYNLVVWSLYNFWAEDPCVLAPLSTLIHSQVMNLNFQCVDTQGNPVCCSCFYASYDSVADDWVVDVNLCLNLERTWCNSGNRFDFEPYILSLCGSQVDLSCLAPVPVTVRWQDAIADPYTINTYNINFWDCFLLSNSSIVGWVKVDINPACILNTLIVDNTVFVMKNWNDSTGLVERFDKPFLTVQAAIDAASASWRYMNVIVYSGIYNETIYLKNNVDVYFHKWTSIIAIAVFANGVVSKVTGHVNILPVYNEWAWFWTAIFIHHNNCEIEVDADKINASTDSELIFLIINISEWSKLRTRIWSIETNASLSWIVTLLRCEWGGASIDAITGVWNVLCPKVRFYTCQNHAEIYWHNSSVVRQDDSNILAYENKTYNVSRTYIQNIFIKGQRYGSGLDHGRFSSISGSIINVNNFVMDLRPKESTGFKSVIFVSQDETSTVNFYNMNQIRANSSRAACTNSLTNTQINVYGRLLSDTAINGIWYGIFNGVHTYEQETHLDIPPYMPFLHAYDNA